MVFCVFNSLHGAYDAMNTQFTLRTLHVTFSEFHLPTLCIYNRFRTPTLRLGLQATFYNSNVRDIIALLLGLQSPKGLLGPLVHLGLLGAQDLLHPWNFLVHLGLWGLLGHLSPLGPQVFSVI